MAKDPALLWYFNDWTGGTAIMSRHVKGCYIDLLAAQFNSGPLSLDEIKTVLGSDFGLAWPTLQKKFAKGDNGLYLNERLQQEKEKRINYSNSRRTNRMKDMTNHMSLHMEDRNENVNKDTNDLPSFLNLKVWNEWIEYRKESKKKLTPLTVKQQLKFLGEHSKDHSAIIERSIQNGWTGLFPLDNKNKGKPYGGNDYVRDRQKMADRMEDIEYEKKIRLSNEANLIAKKFSV